MMRYFNIILVISFLVVCGCDSNNIDVNQYKKEIVVVEKAFEKMVEEDGIAEAFYYFADTSAVINRNDSIIKGKDSIKSYLKKYSGQNISLKWSPDYVDVSSIGDLAYSYGRYKYTITDSLGIEKIFTGIYHTIWRRQNNGEWKYVWE